MWQGICYLWSQMIPTMKFIFSLVLTVIISLQATAQTDIPLTQPLKIEANNNLDLKDSPNKGTALKMPSILDIKPSVNLKDSLTSRPVKMLPDRELKQAGHDMVINPKIGESEKGTANQHFGDMYLGDVRTGGKTVGIVYRDHEYVDGDRVKVYANDNVIEYNVLLTGSFKGINVELDKGFNRLEFEALNQGSSGPNTAQVDVYDEEGKMIYSNKWLLSTGSKASLIVIQD